MSVGKFLRNSGWAALAAALFVTALPAPAAAQNRQERAAQHRPQVQRGDRRISPRQAQQRAVRVDRRTEQRAERIDRRTEQRAARVERRGDQRAVQAARSGQAQQARRIDRRSEQRAAQIERRGDVRAARVERRGDQRAAQIRNNRNVTYADPNRNRTYRDNDRRWDNNRWRDNDRRDYRQWDRRWRDNNRYDWRRYRDRNRVVFNIGTYYSPYRSYSYRRLGIGYTLDSLFFGSRYWINDPWQYRLPEVYGPYRWVRYYDDVLLVDIYSGQVVDVIYDFFW